MNYVFHGSKTSNLMEIEPRISTHQESLVYAAKSPCIATVFLSNGGNDLVYVLGGQGTKEKPAYLVERLPGSLSKIFNNNGSIYTLDDNSFVPREGLWDAEVVAKGIQKVLREEKIDDVLVTLEEYVTEGILKLYRYPDRPNFIPIDNSDLIDKYIRFYQMGNLGDIKRLLSLYPEFEDEVNSRLEKKLTLK